MEAFSSGSELSSAEEASDFEPNTSSQADSRSERASRRSRSGKSDEKQTPDTSSPDLPRRKRSEARDADAHPRTPKAPQPKRAKLASQEDHMEKAPQVSPSIQSTELSTKDLPANPSQSKPKPPVRASSAKPVARVATPASEDSMDITDKRPRAASKTNASEPEFSRNMSGWDQLFGPIAQTSTPKPDTRAKDATPEQRAAAAELAAKEREAELRQRSLREKAQLEKEQEKQAQERKAQEAAAAREAKAAHALRHEQRPTSVSADELSEHRRRLQSAFQNTNHLDLLAGCRLMASFEDEMGADRRHLRPSRFGAGLHYLSLDNNTKQQEHAAPKLNGDAQSSMPSSDSPKNPVGTETKSEIVPTQHNEPFDGERKNLVPIVSSSTPST